MVIKWCVIEIAEQERGIHLNLHLPQLKYEQRKKTGVSTYKAVQTDAQISGPPVQVNHNESNQNTRTMSYTCLRTKGTSEKVMQASIIYVNTIHIQYYRYGPEFIDIYFLNIKCGYVK